MIKASPLELFFKEGLLLLENILYVQAIFMEQTENIKFPFSYAVQFAYPA